MDRLDAMEAFVVTVDKGSLSAAARALGRSPASITRAVGFLEERLGVELLRRTTRSLKLTEAGADYLAVSRRVLADLAAAERVAGGALGVPQGLLTVTAPSMFGALHVRPIVDVYLARYQEVRARLLLLDRVVNIVEEGVDAAVRIAHLPDSALVATAVGHVRRIVCASPRYLAKHGSPRVPSELAAHRCIACSSLTPGDVWKFGPKHGGRSTHVKLHPALTVNTAEAAIGSAVDGYGITCVLSYQAAQAMKAGDLVAVLTTVEPDPLPVHLVVPAGSRTTAKVRAFVDHAVPKLRAALADPTRDASTRSRSRIRSLLNRDGSSGIRVGRSAPAVASPPGLRQHPLRAAAPFLSA